MCMRCAAMPEHVPDVGGKAHDALRLSNRLPNGISQARRSRV
jgi:hypothetical protein